MLKKPMTMKKLYQQADKAAALATKAEQPIPNPPLIKKKLINPKVPTVKDLEHTELSKAFDDITGLPPMTVTKGEVEGVKITEPTLTPHTEALKNALAEKADADYVSNVKPYASHENLVQITQAYKSPVWLTIGEVAKHIKMPLTKFGKLRHTGGPKFYELPEGLILYNVHDVDAWVMSHLPLAIEAKTNDV